MNPKQPKTLNSKNDKLYVKVANRYVCYYDKCPYIIRTGLENAVCPFKDCIFHNRKNLKTVSE